MPGEGDIYAAGWGQIQLTYKGGLVAVESVGFVCLVSPHTNPGEESTQFQTEYAHWAKSI